MREETKTMPTYGTQADTQNRPLEGVSVVGEALRAITPETAEFLIEITASSPNAAQSLRDNHAKSAQLTQAVSALGVQPNDLQTVSLNVYNQFAPPVAALPQYGVFAAGQGLQPEVQFGSYYARRAIRVVVRDLARAGEIADAVVRAGATVVGPSFTFRPADETSARKSALEAAARDARSKAEALATAAGKQLGEPVAVSEDIIATNGAYTALRSAFPFILGAGAPQAAGDLEYYARVSARFRFV
ncbi:MAG TPA: SIMPL domain-containing protein [Bryobacteraceae bacterium]|jgi:hypothetical protein